MNHESTIFHSRPKESVISQRCFLIFERTELEGLIRGTACRFYIFWRAVWCVGVPMDVRYGVPIATTTSTWSLLAVRVVLASLAILILLFQHVDPISKGRLPFGPRIVADMCTFRSSRGWFNNQQRLIATVFSTTTESSLVPVINYPQVVF